MKVVLALFLVVASFLLQAQEFPQNYTHSRSRFLAYKSEYSKKYINFKHLAIPLSESDLSVDLFYIPARSETKNLIIITSGTHGPEAYLGSALQYYFMQNVLPNIEIENTGVILIHALNAWGFKHHKRADMNNINLNRNFDLDKNLFETKNLGYEKLKENLEIRSELSSLYSFPAFSLLKKLAFESNVSIASLTEAIGKGQYSSPTGINYGGSKFTKQTVAIVDFLKKYAQSYHRFLHIDLHTGLGDKGVLHIMPSEKMNMKSKSELSKLFQPSEHYNLTLGNSSGFYEIKGNHVDILNLIIEDKDKTILGITAEFGTIGAGIVGKVRTINRLILENQGRFAGYSSKEIQTSIEKDYLELFFPSDLAWRKKVLTDGKYLMNTIVPKFVKD